MPDEKQLAALDRATTKGGNAERKRINAIIADAVADAKNLEDKGQKKAVSDALKAVKTRIKDEVPA